MTTSFAPSLPTCILSMFFKRHISSEHCDTKVAFFKHANLQKVNFVSKPVSVSAKHSPLQQERVVWGRGEGCDPGS